MLFQVVSAQRGLRVRARRLVSILCGSAICLALSPTARGAVIFDQTLAGKSATTGKDLAAHVVFGVTGNTLSITTTNTGSAAEAPSDVLTGILWDFNTPQALKVGGVDFTTKTGAERDRLMHPTGNESLGKHWQYLQFASPVGNQHYGLGASGLGGTFGTANFVAGGLPLQGVDYGIVDGMGKKPNNGTNVPLVSHSLTFSLTGDFADVPTTPLEVMGLRLQYGSQMSEPFTAFGTAVPEPAIAGVLAIGAFAGLRRRRI